MIIHTNINAQTFHGKDKFQVGWDIAFSSNKFISNTSLAGLKLGYHRNLNPT